MKNLKFEAEAGEDGYFLIPTVGEQNRPSGLVRFRPRPDMEECYSAHDLPVFGIKRGNHAILAVVSGADSNYSLIFGVKNNRYYLYPRFETPAEVTLFELEGDDAGYCGMARRYRRYQLERGACRPLKERCNDYPVLKEALPALEIRVRMAWKPVPPDILEQTPENEPPMTVAVTFDRACEILDECHRRGIRKAEFCLVGWNKSGHDGRFPDLLPVEPLLGGPDGLKRLVEKAREYGYLLSCHTNLLDSYTISKRLDRNDWLLDADGTPHKGGCWGGGQSYYLCPEMAHKHYAAEDFELLKNLGFRGLHYLDVMSIVAPNPCYHPDHPLTKGEAAAWRGKTLSLARERIGGSASEGGLDFCIGDLDYALYVWFDLDPARSELIDELVPFWFIVYHGIVLYNAATCCANAMIKEEPELQLKNIELGGRPLAYFHSRFLHSGSNWMGDRDLRCSTDEELRHGAGKLAGAEKLYDTLSDLQYEFLEEHKMLTPEVAYTRYSDNSIVIVNYGNREFHWEKGAIAPKSFRRF